MSVQIVNLVLYSLMIGFDIIGVSTTIVLFLVMYIRRSLLKTDKVSYLLAANSYFAFFMVTPTFLDMGFNSIYGQLHPDSSFDGRLCRFKSYAVYVTGCAYFYSFLLQAIYRFCRIVYPTRPALQSFKRYVILSIIQWIAAITSLLPSYLAGDIEYLSNDYHCQFSPTNLRGTLIGLSILFLIPFFATVFFYVYTMYYVHKRTAALTTLSRNTGIRRDFLILTRLFVLFTFITTIAFPHVLIPIFYAMTGYLPHWTASFEWFLTLVSLVITCILQIIVTPHLRKLFTRSVRVQIAGTINTIRP